MAEPDAPCSRRLLLALLLAVPLAGCAGAGAPPPGAPQPTPAALDSVTPDVLAAWADLLRLEDRREYDAPTLRRHAEASSPLLRRRAALALGRLRRPEGAPELLRLMADSDTSVAATAAFALGQLGDSVHAAALADALGRPDAASHPTVASEAAYALGKVGGTAGRDALLAYLGAAPLAGDARADVVASALLAVWRLPRSSDLAPLTRWLQAPDGELRWRAAYALARRADHRALPSLRTVLPDPDPRVRALALRGLTGALADSAGVDRAALLAEVLPHAADTSYIVAINAIRTLGSFADPRAALALAQIAAGADAHRAVTAMESLGRIGSAAAETSEVLLRAAASEALPTAVRGSAVEALSAIDTLSAGRVVERFAGSADWRLRAAAARAAARIDAADGARLRPLLGDADPRVVNAALQAAIDAAGDSIVPLRPRLVEQLGAADAVVRATALTALARIADPALLPALLDAYARAQRDTLNDAALAAVDAIAAIRRDGFDPARAFFGRFERSADALVRVRVGERFDSATAAAAWGDPLPVETDRSPEDYRRLVERWVAPALAGSPAPEASIVTRGDTIRLRLFPLDATLTVDSFGDLAAAGFFDGQEWPRVVANFVVQGGDPRGDTSGGPGYTIRDEINRHRYGAGTVGMALAGPDTGGSQFFVTHSPQPHLDGIYAVFGEVIDGQEVTETILPAHTIERIRTTP
ncbi:MAG TPA: HEAT repeat domain-containing protein [Longimicrobiaceae bacterium]